MIIIKRLIKYTRSVLLLLLIFISFSACSSSPTLIEKYPDFLQRKDHISSISLCTDVLVVFDGVESGVVIDIPLSLIAGDSVLSLFKHGLEKKNYEIGKIYPTAVGYSLAGDEKHYKVFETETDYDLSTDSLKTISAPFLIDDEFLELEDVWNKNDQLINNVSADDSSSNWEQNQEKNYLLYINLEAQNVSTTKRLAEGLLTTLLTLGAATSSPEAEATASYWLYDMQSGKIVLSDGRIMRGPNLSGDNVVDLLEEMINNIPPKEK